MKTADIFIPTSNRIDSLKTCLDSLSKQTRKDFRIILVGLSEDAAVAKLVSSYTSLTIEYILQKQKGLIGAANEAIKIANARIFIRIDDDVFVEPTWFENLVITFESDASIGGVTGPTVMSDEGINSRDLTSFLDKFDKSKGVLSKIIKYIYFDFLYEGKIYDVSTFLPSGVFTIGSNYKSCLSLQECIDVNNLEACNWSCRRELLLDIGGFDPIYIRGLGDYHEADAAMKIKRLGFRLVFNPKVYLHHNVEMGKVQSARPAPYYRIQNFIIFYFRFFKFKSFKQLLQFFVNLAMQNAYYLLKYTSTGKVNQLGALFGTVVGFIRVMFKYEN